MHPAAQEVEHLLRGWRQLHGWRVCVDIGSGVYPRRRVHATPTNDAYWSASMSRGSMPEWSGNKML